VEGYRNGRALPDGALAPVGYFAGQGDWADPDGVLMTVEVTSYDSDTHDRDRVEKPRGYAEAGVPVYLLIDREHASVVVHSKPDPEGDKVTLPEPVGITLDTNQLKPYLV
jgi:Uma2 family endonuclease